MKILFTTLILFFCFNSYSQNTIEKIQSEELNFIFNHIRNHNHFESQSLSVNIYLVDQRSKKHYFKETDEVLSDLYVGVSEFGEHPNTKLFRISNIMSIDSNSVKIYESPKKYISFEYKILLKNGEDYKIVNSLINL
jgi:hypothetical protein